jgi:hypothetical protein
LKSNIGSTYAGLGTTTPNWLLQLATTSGPQLVLTDPSGNTNNKHLVMRYGDGNFYIGSSTDDLTATSTGITYSSITNNLGVATTAPWRTLSVAGTAALSGLTAESGTKDALCIDSVTKEVQVNTGSPTCTVSSARYKHNIESLTATSGLALIRQLRPVSFETNDENQARVGFIAEEVNALDPRLVFYEDDGITPRGVRYEEMTAVLAKSVQELDARLLNLESASSTLLTLSTPSGLDAIKSALSSFGIFVSEGLVHIANAAVDTLTVGSSTAPAGITLFDQTTKNPYCVAVNNGQVETTSGACTSGTTTASTIYVAPSSTTTSGAGATGTATTSVPIDTGTTTSSTASSTISDIGTTTIPTTIPTTTAGTTTIDTGITTIPLDTSTATTTQ